MRGFAHVVGFDDAPFAPGHHGDVLLVGAVYSGLRLEGVLSAKVRRDGVNATETLIRLVRGCRHARHLRAVLLQGVAFAGFNVVDLPGLHAAIGIPVISVARKRPDLIAVERALRSKVRGGPRKWQLIEQLEPMEPLANVFVQRLGIGREQTRHLIERLAVAGSLPEPLRTAHLIAGGIATGESRHRP